MDAEHHRVSHHEALAALEAGRPRQALAVWRQLLQAEQPAVRAHLERAQALLPRDPIAPLRCQALALAHALLTAEPGEAEVQQLGALLRAWGELCLAEVPGRALEHLERAWVCGRDPQLDRLLASLHARLGYGEGAWALAPMPATPEPWPVQPCPAHACGPCQQQPPPPDPDPQLALLPQGRIWVQRHTNPWHLTHGIAVLDRQGRYEPGLCRRYPWPWPACPHHAAYQHLALHQLPLAAGSLPPAAIAAGPVLAVAELSGELYFHWQMELLPRLGRIWRQALGQWPELRLWHNGSQAPWVSEGLQRLGIPPERVLPTSAHLQAELLIVPTFAAHFGSPAQANLAWLEQFWQVDQEQGLPCGGQRGFWMSRSSAVRRPVLAEHQWHGLLAPRGITPLDQGSVALQLAQVAKAGTLVAPHGAGMSNLLAARPGSTVLELVNPAYRPAYFAGLLQRRQLGHRQLAAAPTPWPLQEWLYEGPMAFPIDLRPGASEAAEALANLMS